jgi:hypothetical protein
MTQVEFYEVYDNYSMDGLGSDSIIIGRFMHYSDAITFAKKRGNYEHDAQVRNVNLKIYDSLKDIDSYKIANH